MKEEIYKEPEIENKDILEPDCSGIKYTKILLKKIRAVYFFYLPTVFKRLGEISQIEILKLKNKNHTT